VITWGKFTFPPVNLYVIGRGNIQHTVKKSLITGEKTMLTYLPKLPDDAPDNAPCECEECGVVSEAWELNSIEDFHRHMYAGDTVPAGQCPKCDGFAYLLEGDSGED
jgi:hypothetical protein